MSKIIRHLTAVSRCGVEYRKQQLGSLPIDGRSARYLLEVCDRPGISQEAMSRRLLVDKSTVARQSATLEDAGLLLRKPCPEDKRLLLLYPTEKTLALLPQLQKIWDDWEALVTEDLTEQERETLAELLLKMKKRARQWMEDQ